MRVFRQRAKASTVEREEDSLLARERPGFCTPLVERGGDSVQVALAIRAERGRALLLQHLSNEL